MAGSVLVVEDEREIRELLRRYRVTGGIPAQDLRFATFQPAFLYEQIWDLALAAFLVWLGHHAKIRP